MRYYLINYDGDERIDVDVSDCLVDGLGNVDEKDAAIAAIDQLGWTLCAEDE